MEETTIIQTVGENMADTNTDTITFQPRKSSRLSTSTPKHSTPNIKDKKKSPPQQSKYRDTIQFNFLVCNNKKYN